MAKGTVNVGPPNKQKGDASELTAAFTAATTRANIATGEKLSVIFGKLAKWFVDLKTVAFTGSYNDLSDKPTIPSSLTVDSALSSTSTNPVQNKVVYSALAGKAASSHNHAASEINSGTLPVARGGTGVTSLDALKTALGITSGGAKIQTGTYTGTNTFGENNPNSLTFNFVPKMVVVAWDQLPYMGYESGSWRKNIFWIGQKFENAYQPKFMYTLSGNTLTWYSTEDADYQCNKGSTKYHWIAFG